MKHGLANLEVNSLWIWSPQSNELPLAVAAHAINLDNGITASGLTQLGIKQAFDRVDYALIICELELKWSSLLVYLDSQFPV